MNIYDSIPEKESFSTPVLTIGNFDGVHLGHQRILSALLNTARKKGGDAVAMSFRTHPRKILTPRTPPKILTTADEKIRAIYDFGIENIIMLNFTKEMANMNARTFLNEIVLGKLGVVNIVVGYDHAFGKNREGTFGFLKEISRERGIGVTRVEPKNFYSKPVSSTWIRTEIEDGNIGQANTLLGRRYTLSGRVMHGKGRGRLIGFPTANIMQNDPDKVIPKDGVYAVTVTIDKMAQRQGMLNIGTNPTFAESNRTIEVHIFDFDKDIYGSEVELEFYERIRNEVRFNSPKDLVEQIKKDRLAVLQVLNE